MGRKPRNKSQFRERRPPKYTRRSNAVRFETRGQKRERHKKTALFASCAFLASVTIGIVSLWVWPAGNVPMPNESLQDQFAQSDSQHPKLALCGEGQRVSCVVDGDTIWLHGEKIRIADIDTPEVSEPRCDSEYQLGLQATYRLRDLLNQGPWSLEPIGSRDTDDYGRSLRILTRNGHSIGDMLVQEGLARTWTGRREPWC